MERAFPDMGRPSFLISSFLGGEVAEGFLGRVDMERYYSSCLKIRNFELSYLGGVYKSPGLRYAAETKDSTKKSRLIEFEFNRTQKYILEFGNYYVRFYKDGQLLMDDTEPYEVATPYSENDLDDLDYKQSADVVFLTHPDYAVRRLCRYGDTNWTLENYDFLNGPFMMENTTDVTLTLSAVGGSTGLKGESVDCTASSALFASGDVGRWIKIRHDTSTGYLKITSFTSTTVVRCLVMQDATWLGTAKKTWALGAWGNVPGWPTACTFFQGRIWFGGTKTDPHTLWGSVSQDYYDFEGGAEDDNAITYELLGERISIIRWLKSKRDLVVGSATGEWVLLGSPDNPVTPSSVYITRDTEAGSAKKRALILNDNFLFVQYDERRVRNLVYDSDSESFYATDLSVFAPHILKSGVVDLCIQEEPIPVGWFISEDGKAGCLYLLPEQQVLAWTVRETYNGVIESVASVSGYVYMVVKRTINGATKRYVEYFTPWDETLENAFFVDCGVVKTYETATDTITGLDHLEGESVCVFNGVKSLGNYTVVGGQITLSEEVTKAVIGYPITSQLEPVPFEIPRQGGTSQGYLGNVTRIVVRLWKSMGGYIGQDSDTLQNISTSGIPVTDDIPFHLGGGPRPKPRVYIKHEDPTPFNILCLIPEVEVER